MIRYEYLHPSYTPPKTKNLKQLKYKVVKNDKFNHYEVSFNDFGVLFYKTKPNVFDICRTAKKNFKIYAEVHDGKLMFKHT